MDTGALMAVPAAASASDTASGSTANVRGKVATVTGPGRVAELTSASSASPASGCGSRRTPAA